MVVPSVTQGNQYLHASPKTVKLPCLPYDPTLPAEEVPLEKITTKDVQVVRCSYLGDGLASKVAFSYAGHGRVADPEKETGYRLKNRRFDQMMALGAVTQTYDVYKTILEREELNWVNNQKRIIIVVRSGNRSGPRYARGNPEGKTPLERQDRLMLTFIKNAKTQKHVYSSQSKQIIDHETAHGLEDALRPLHNETIDLETNAFKEGHADVTHMFMSLMNPDFVKKVLKQTGGDLSQPNYITDFAREWSQALADNSQVFQIPVPEPRSVISDPKVFQVTDWHKLPPDSGKELAAEPHSYSQIWSGAWYDDLTGVYKYLQQNAAMTPEQALAEAGQVMTSIAVRQFDFSPVANPYFDQTAFAELKALKTDFHNSPHYEDYKKIIEKVFIDRGILTQDKIDAWEQKEKLLPSLALGKGGESAFAAVRWLKDNADVLRQFDPDLAGEVFSSLRYDGTYSNKKGETFLSFVNTRVRTFTEDDFTRPYSGQGKAKDSLVGKHFMVNGGLTLGFDSSGKLFAYVLDNPSQDKIEDLADYLTEDVDIRTMAQATSTS